MTFGKLSEDNELVAMRASGINFMKIMFPLILLTLAICGGSLLLSDQVAAKAHYGYRKIAAQIGLTSPEAALEEGTFIKRFKNFVIFIYEIDKNKLKGVRIYQPQKDRPTRTITAQKGEIITHPDSNLVLLRLTQGTSDEPDPKDPGKLYKLNFKTYDLPLNTDDINKEGEKELGKKPKDMTIRELKDEINRLGVAGIKATYPLSTEIHHKFAMALSPLAFMLIGIPLGIVNRRSDKNVSFGVALVLVTAHWLLLIMGKALAQKGSFDPFISLQMANMVIGSIGLWLCVRMERI